MTIHDDLNISTDRHDRALSTSAREEGRRNFLSELGKSKNVVPSGFGETEEHDQSGVDYFAVPTYTADQHLKSIESTDFSLKLFQPLPPSNGCYLPLEQTLTPGFGDPTYFTGPALMEMNILHGDIHGIEKRSNIGHMNAKSARGNKPRKQSSIHTDKSERIESRK